MEANYKVGQFVLEKRIGEGGMAEVWLARNIHLGTPVAVKFLIPQFGGRKDIEERFLNEGKRQGALDHPNIVKVFGFEYVEDRSFLLLQYIEGESLEDRILRNQRRPLPFNSIRDIATGVLNALDFAHARHIVHRDVKPSNILLDASDHAFLGDFGIVLAMNERRLTRTGTVMGTPYYMSPEQITRPMELDHRSDIYSFGCVLYEMFTGRTPFEDITGEGDTDFNVKLAHAQQPPPPMRQFNPDIPFALEQVVMRCLAKDLTYRYATARELRDALLQAFSSPGAPPLNVDPDPFPFKAPGPVIKEEVFKPRVPIQKDQLPTPIPGPVKKPAFPLVLVALIAVLFVGAASGGGYYIWKDHQQKEADKKKEQENTQRELIQKEEEAKINPVKEKEGELKPPPVDIPEPIVKPVERTEEKKSQKNINPGREEKQTQPVLKDKPVEVIPPPVKEDPQPIKTQVDRQPTLNDSVLRVALLAPVSTSRSEEGDKIRARVMSPASMAGSVLEGVVTKSKRTGRFSKKSELLFGFHTLHMNGGKEIAVNSQVISFKNSKGKAHMDEEGEMIETSNGMKKVAIFAAAGTALGALIKGKKGALIGGGAGAGSALMLNTFASKGPDISFDAGSEFELKVNDRSGGDQ